MDAAAYRDYQRESESWLKKGRCNLLRSMVREAGGSRRDLKLLEVGAGVGQNVSALAEFGQVDVIEISDVGLDALRKMPDIRRVIGEPIPLDLEETYDVIVAMDVVEHIEDDREALSWMAERLNPGGLLFVTVPAYQWLFSEHDTALHHFRRYTARQLKSALPSCVEVLRCGYFNTVLFPVAASVRLANRLVGGHSTERPARKQSGLVPRPVNAVFQGVLDSEVWAIRRGFDLPFGLSVYCLARRSPG